MTRSTTAHIVTTAALLTLCSMALAGKPSQSVGELQGLGSWQGVRSLRLGKHATVTPEVPLRLELSAGGHVKAGIVDDPSGDITLQQYKGHVRGVVRSKKHGTYLIQQAPGGEPIVTALDPASLTGCGAESLPVVGLDGDGDGPQGPLSPPVEGDGPDGDSGGVVDVFVAYTSLARANAGSIDAMNTAIRGWVNQTNDVYRDSDMAVRIRLVGTDEVDYNESGSYNNHVERLAATNDGVMDEVHTWRADTGADIVVLAVTDSSSCGIGYTIKNDVTGYPDYAFAVVRDYCADVQYTFAHELGHVMGCCHDADHPGSCAGGNSLYAYSFGKRFVGDGGNWRTVMAYTDGTGDPMPWTYYTRIGYFSNPDIEYDGETTGSLTCDNAASQDSMRVVTAGYVASLAPISCPGDIGEDAVVSVDDLLGLLQRWGVVDGDDAASLAADLNGDAEIDTSDLLVLLAEFGPCPE